MIARNVFQMDEEHGRARAFNQVLPGRAERLEETRPGRHV